MSFPVAISNGQTALVNGITYVWNTSIGTNVALLDSSGNFIANGNVTANGAP
jgi:hypothetical protein